MAGPLERGLTVCQTASFDRSVGWLVVFFFEHFAICGLALDL